MSIAKGVLGLIVCLALSACTTSFVPKTREADPSETARQFQSARDQLQVRTPAERTGKDPLVLVHYMPWFQAPPVSDGYGFHWHMGGGVFDPYRIRDDGKVEIASHYYPMTGPYDTRDPAILEYQVATMKAAGVDGVIFDWYGIEEALDYREIHESTLAMVEVLKKAGMKFAICYEDQSIGKMISANLFTRDEALAYGKKVMNWMGENWFSDPAYLTWKGRPVLLNFGPQYFKDPRLWPQLFEGVDPKPYFISLDNHNEASVDGSYNWPPMWASTGGKLSIPRLVSYLNEYYTKQLSKPYLVASAFPAFHDIYAQAGTNDSYGYLDYANGETFRLTMEAALAANPDVIQIATWNDYGEGTIVEPTVERGFRELEYLQQVQKDFDPAFPFSKDDIRVPLELYRKKTAQGASPETVAAVDRVYSALFAGNKAAFDEAAAAAKVILFDTSAPVLRQAPRTAAAAEVKIEMAFELGDRKNLALGKTTTASSKIYEFTATKAVDGETLSYWEGGANTYPNLLTVDLGASRKLAGIILKLNPQRIWTKRTQAIGVLVSDDGRDFRAAVESAEYVFDPATRNTVSIAVPASGRFVRLSFTSNTEAKAGQVAEFEIYGE